MRLVTRTGIHPTATLQRDSGKDYPAFVWQAQKFAKATRAAGSGDYSVPDGAIPILDQKNLGSCVTNATAAAAEIALAIEGKPWKPLARLWLYYLCSRAQGTIGFDTGTEVALAVDRAQKLGFATEARWPYTDDPNAFYKVPADALDLIEEAADNRLTYVARIDDAIGMTKADQIELAVRADHTPIFGTPVSAAVQNYQPGQVLSRPSAADIIGGHSMIFTGVRRVNGAREFRVRNSWGADWGESGYCWFSEDFVEWSELNDVWVISRMADLIV